MWQEYTELYKKDLHDPDNYDGVIIHLEPDIAKLREVSSKLKTLGVDITPLLLETGGKKSKIFKCTGILLYHKGI